MCVAVSDPVELVLCRLLDRRVALREHADQLASADRFFDEPHRAFAGDRQRQKRIRKQHRVAQRKNRQFARYRDRVLGRRFPDFETFVFTTHGDTPRWSCSL
jgi:hypothetical protein